MRRRWPHLVIACAALGIGVFLFQSRLDTVGFFDGSEFALHIRGGGMAHAPGYPLYILLGKLFLLLTGDVFWAQHLVGLASLVVASTALWLTLWREAAGDPAGEFAASCTVLALVSSFYVRLFTIVPEVFLPNLALFALLGLAAQRWTRNPRATNLFWIFLIYGLGLSLHHSLALTLPAVAWLLFVHRDLLRPPIALAWAVGGFFLGALPILELLRPAETAPSTYYFVHTIADLFYVLLRRGYGVFRLTTLARGVNWGALLSLVTQAATKNFGLLGFFFLALVPLLRDALSALDRRELPPRRWNPLLVFSIFTLATFAIVVLGNANVPLDNATYRNTFCRLLTVPFFLALYPLFFALRATFRAAQHFWGEPRGLLYVWAAVIAAGAISNAATAGELRYRGFDRLHRHLALGYQTIFSRYTLAPSAVAERHFQCAVFVQSDSLLFGLEYFNQFETDKRCFVFSLSSFSDQFHSRDEEALERQVFGAQLPELIQTTGGNSRALLPAFFQALHQRGFRLFVFYQPDYVFLNHPQTPFVYRPVGNILEVFPEEKSGDSFLDPPALFADYLDSLERFHDTGPRDLDVVIDTAIYENLNEYSRTVSDASLATRADAVRKSRE